MEQLKIAMSTETDLTIIDASIPGASSWEEEAWFDLVKKYWR